MQWNQATADSSSESCNEVRLAAAGLGSTLCDEWTGWCLVVEGHLGDRVELWVRWCLPPLCQRSCSSSWGHPRSPCWLPAQAAAVGAVGWHPPLGCLLSGAETAPRWRPREDVHCTTDAVSAPALLGSVVEMSREDSPRRALLAVAIPDLDHPAGGKLAGPRGPCRRRREGGTRNSRHHGLSSATPGSQAVDHVRPTFPDRLPGPQRGCRSAGRGRPRGQSWAISSRVP